WARPVASRICCRSSTADSTTSGCTTSASARTRRWEPARPAPTRRRRDSEHVITDADLGAARDRLAQLQREAHAAAAETAQLAARLEQETYSAWSRGREVRVTVGADALIQG